MCSVFCMRQDYQSARQRTLYVESTVQTPQSEQFGKQAHQIIPLLSRFFSDACLFFFLSLSQASVSLSLFIPPCKKGAAGLESCAKIMEIVRARQGGVTVRTADNRRCIGLQIAPAHHGGPLSNCAYSLDIRRVSRICRRNARSSSRCCRVVSRRHRYRSLNLAATSKPLRASSRNCRPFDCVRVVARNLS